MTPASSIRFADLVASFDGYPDVALPGASGNGRKFGADALKVGGKIFAMLVDGRLVVKLPKRRVEELALVGEGTHFDPGHGRLMKEWLWLDEGSSLDWRELALEALAFVGGGSPRPTSPSKRAAAKKK